MPIFICPCGKQSVEFQRGGSVGDEAKKSGFVSVLTHECAILWLCQECFVRAHELAEQLLAVVKNKNFYFQSLLKKN